MKEEKITKADFTQWRRNRVTEEVFEALHQSEKYIETVLATEAHLLDKDVRVNSARLLGQLEGIRMILNIHVDEVIEDESNE